ncbi:MAG TPA: hypothetical protein VE972_12130 [Conexibacter sp.]|nr:hypothetical protein [Conexibacter sp.]
MPPRRRYERDEPIAPGILMRCRWDVERDVVSFAVVLVIWAYGAWRPVALFDCSHDERNDWHRYDRHGLKGAAEPFHHGTPAEGYREAVALIRADHERMIEQWRP